MKQLLRSAWVIGRRDFTATVWSKAFIFFLIGPLFPVLLGALFGGIGARVASQAEEPRVAVVASKSDFARLKAAHRQLEQAFGDRPIIQLVEVEPEDNTEEQQRELLDSRRRPVVAVLTGGLERPHLTGAINIDGTVAGQVGMLIEAARAPATGAPELSVTSIERSTGSETRSRAITAQIGQMILFFLTIILAGMTLSQLIEEKSNKVIEVLAAAVPIEAIFLGKLFAMLAASIVGIVVWVSAGALAISLLVEGGTGALPVPAVGSTIFLALIVIYFAMNYLLLGSVFLSIGAQASTVREVQTLSMPVTVAQVLIFGFAALAVGSPDSTMAMAGAVFPLSSPLVMVARAAEQPELWPHLVAILWQGLWVGLIVIYSARMFRRTVLKSGPVRRKWWSRASA
ncbi:MAG TPA: ABC transporter permease [Sphingomicrobium sp.]|nr:ABC transporter permease [Sphingomicrobium sp.]